MSQPAYLPEIPTKYPDNISDAASGEMGPPSESAIFLYEAMDFRVGGRDVFRCGSKDDPAVSRCDDLLRHRPIGSFQAE